MHVCIFILCYSIAVNVGLLNGLTTSYKTHNPIMFGLIIGVVFNNSCALIFLTNLIN